MINRKQIFGFTILAFIAIYAIYIEYKPESKKPQEVKNEIPFPLIKKEGDELVIKTAEEIKQEEQDKRDKEWEINKPKPKFDCYVDYRKTFTKVEGTGLEYLNLNDIDDRTHHIRVWQFTFTNREYGYVPMNRNVEETYTHLDTKIGKEKILIHKICINEQGNKSHYYELYADKKTLDKMLDIEWE